MQGCECRENWLLHIGFGKVGTFHRQILVRWNRAKGSWTSWRLKSAHLNFTSRRPYIVQASALQQSTVGRVTVGTFSLDSGWACTLACKISRVALSGRHRTANIVICRYLLISGRHVLQFYFWFHFIAYWNCHCSFSCNTSWWVIQGVLHHFLTWRRFAARVEYHMNTLFHVAQVFVFGIRIR